MLRLTSEPQKRRPALPECSRFLFGLALLLTMLSDGAMNNRFTALSSIITANSDPSALLQLATFAAMEDYAEEEHLDWGSTGRLVRAQPMQLVRPRNAIPPESTQLSSAASHTHHRTDSENALSSGLSKSLTGTSTDEAAGSSSAESSSFSRRRPHRRHHRRSGSVAEVPFSSEDDVKLSATRPAHSYLMWTRLHVMEMAYSTGSNNFVHITECFLQYQQMYPTIYCCDLSKVDCPYEAELLAYPKVGLAASSRWTCEKCGKKHSIVRESCLRCRTPGQYAKLFIGQAVKEVDCAKSLLRFIYATHPDIMIHRVECHYDTGAGASGRGRGCASIYVRRKEAALLQEKLNRNALFDVGSVTENLLVYYVYAEQQQWLQRYAQERTAVTKPRPFFLPMSPLVVEESRPPTPARRPAGRK